MDSSKQTPKLANATSTLVPIFIEVAQGQDVKDLVYFKTGADEYKSLAQLQAASAGSSAEVPGLGTAGIIDTSGTGTTFQILSVSPFKVCCVPNGMGGRICYNCP